MSSVEIQDVGPVKRLTLPVPEHGGIVVLRGINGAGKTKTLEAVEKLASGRGQVAVRDGALRGRVQGFGATLTVARSTTRRGEIEVESLDGKLSIADLVQPPIKDAAAADAKRIKSLVSLAGAKADPALFYGLVGGEVEFTSMIPLAEADDLVEMASKIKREFEAMARKSEDAAQKAHVKAAAHREAIGGLDLSKPMDREAAYAELQAATQQHTELSERKRAAEEAGEAAAEARKQLAAAEKAYDGPTVQETTQTLEVAWHARKEALEAMRVAQQVADEAKATAEKLLKEEEIAGRAAKAAQQHASAMAAWRETLEKDAPLSPEPPELLAAAQRITEARAATSRLAGYEQAQQQYKQAVQGDAEEASHTEAAGRLRDAARGTDDVLSEIVGQLGTPLRVQAGRLVLDTGRGTTCFHELSHGERWRLGLDIAVTVAGDRTIFTIPQEAWESLDPQNRAEVGRHVQEKGVVIFTAESSADPEVRAELHNSAHQPEEASPDDDN